jgi:hypothetical protein
MVSNFCEQAAKQRDLLWLGQSRFDRSDLCWDGLWRQPPLNAMRFQHRNQAGDFSLCCGQ